MIRRLIVLSALVLAGACGGSATGPSATKPSVTNISGSVGNFGTNEHAFTAPRGGTMTIVLQWSTNADLDLYLTNSTCSSFNINSCTLLGSATGTAGAREQVQRSVNSGEQMKIFVDNASVNLSASYTLVITIE